jgi:hypothetical protein
LIAFKDIRGLLFQDNIFSMIAGVRKKRMRDIGEWKVRYLRVISGALDEFQAYYRYNIIITVLL